MVLIYNPPEMDDDKPDCSITTTIHTSSGTGVWQPVWVLVSALTLCTLPMTTYNWQAPAAPAAHSVHHRHRHSSSSLSPVTTHIEIIPTTIWNPSIGPLAMFLLCLQHWDWHVLWGSSGPRLRVSWWHLYSLSVDITLYEIWAAL